MRRRCAALAIALLALPGAGCGSDDEELTPGSPATPVGSGTLTYALTGRPNQIDPLLARGRPALTVTRQVHEPLVEDLRGPFGDTRNRRGLARAWRASAGGTIWSLTLRRRVRFQDGTPFNAAAVVANTDRWRTVGSGPELLPELEAADAPQPDRVRLILSRPLDDLPDRLRDTRLGIVSPTALRPSSGEGARLSRSEMTGTGPFELREQEGARTIVARNSGWWGRRLGLGPGLDQIEFVAVRGAARRLAALEASTSRVAAGLGESAVESLRRDPLLTFVRGPEGRVVGMERSVRGIDTAAAGESLNDVWLTLIGG